MERAWTTLWWRTAVVFWLVAAAACSSPAAPGSGPPGDGAAEPRPATPLDGTYSSGEYILRLQEGRWSVNQPPRAGEFIVSGDQLILSNEEGCPGEGTYTWTLEGEVLTLAKVEDLCAARNVRFPSIQKWSILYTWGEPLEIGDHLLLSDGLHAANYHGQEDITGQTEATLEVSTTSSSGVVFSPTVLIGSPGQTIQLTIRNPDRRGTERQQHNFNIDELGIVKVEVPYGEEVAITVSFPESGGLRFYCAYHVRFGQQGELLVA